MPEGEAMSIIGVKQVEGAEKSLIGVEPKLFEVVEDEEVKERSLCPLI